MPAYAESSFRFPFSRIQIGMHGHAVQAQFSIKHHFMPGRECSGSAAPELWLAEPDSWSEIVNISFAVASKGRDIKTSFHSSPPLHAVP